MKNTKFNWMVFDLGYGLGVCPRECQEALIPNVAAVQHAIVKFKSPQNDEELSDQLEICRLVAAAPEMLEALEFIRADINDPLMEFDQDTIVKRYSDFINKVLTKAKGV